jgi:hypothetical protein
MVRGRVVAVGGWRRENPPTNPPSMLPSQRLTQRYSGADARCALES